MTAILNPEFSLIFCTILNALGKKGREGKQNFRLFMNLSLNLVRKCGNFSR